MYLYCTYHVTYPTCTYTYTFYMRIAYYISMATFFNMLRDKQKENLFLHKSDEKR